MPRRTIVDPQFGARLRVLRRERSLSLKDLARLAYVGKSTLSQLENGRIHPSTEMAGYLDRALDAGGQIAGLVTPAPEPEPELAGHVEYALARPTRLDAAAVEGLAQVLAAHRRLDDALDARVLLPAVDVESRTVSRLAQEARGPHAGDLYRAAAEWSQFVGWLMAESRHDAEAIRTLDRAHAEAVELEDGPLAAQAADFRAYLARLRQEWRSAARWSATAAATAGATSLQRAQNLSHAAYALARMGEHRDAAKLLGQARDVVDADEPQPDTVYWLSAGFIRLGIGLALLGIRDRQAAAEQLHAGLAGLPEGWADAEWAAEYRAALAEATR